MELSATHGPRQLYCSTLFISFHPRLPPRPHPQRHLSPEAGRQADAESTTSAATRLSSTLRLRPEGSSSKSAGGMSKWSFSGLHVYPHGDSKKIRAIPHNPFRAWYDVSTDRKTHDNWIKNAPARFDSGSSFPRQSRAEKRSRHSRRAWMPSP